MEPEKLAAVLARYSRSNTGCEHLAERHADDSPEAIFKFVDYGHASIAGLTGGIAIALDGVTMLLAYKLFEFAQMADGQESSTRYIPMDKSALPTPEELGIPDHLAKGWVEVCELGFELYRVSTQRLEEEIAECPELLKIPEDRPISEKVRERLRRNYALDRSRYFLPAACKTNIALVATARVWADIIKMLDGLMWPEAVKAARLLRSELEKAAPNLVRHSYADPAVISYHRDMLQAGSDIAACYPEVTSGKTRCRVLVEDHQPAFLPRVWQRDEKQVRANRYSHTGLWLKRQTVRVEWSHVALAELRDLNRHRTGYRYSPLAPRGFYLPSETLAVVQDDANPTWISFRHRTRRLMEELARSSMPGLHAYGFFLGTQVGFEHVQQADKFLYEVELRTGLGAHFRYAEHLKQAAEQYFVLVPEARDFVVIGDAEPE